MKIVLFFIRRVVIFIILFYSLRINAQVNTSTGTDFWMGFTYTFQPGETSSQYKLWISSVAGASGTVSVPLGAWSSPFTVAANSTIVITIPYAKVQNETSESIQPKGVHIISDGPVSVIGSMYSIVRPEATLVMSTPALGTEYYVQSYPGYWYGQSHFQIVATQNSTVIQITPTSRTAGNKAPGVPFSITLDSGQVYLVRAQNAFGNANCDLTGTKIIGSDPCKKFAVFGGAAEVDIPIGCGTADPIYEELQPVSTWGKEYIVPPFYTHTGSLCRIVASQANTSVVIDGGAPIVLNAGQFNEQLFNGSAHCITADKPIQVAQYMKGNTCNGGTKFASSNGDPCMLVLNSNNQMVNTATFRGFNQPVVPQHLVNVVMKTAYTSQLKLNGATVSPTWTAVSNCSGYSYATLLPANITNAVTHTLAADSGFVGYCYGYGSGDASYAFPLGYSISSVPPAITGILGICSGSSTTLTASGGGTYVWSPGGATTTSITVTPAATTTYTLTVTGGSCSVSGGTVTAVVTVSSGSTANAGNDVSICAGSNTTLNASGGGAYSWSPATGLSNSTISNPVASPLVTTTYTLTVGSGSCTAQDQVIITVNSVPTITVPVPGVFCGNTNVILTASGATSYSWSPSTGLSTTTGSTVTAAPLTTITYTVTGFNGGCSASATVVVTRLTTPVADFTMSPAGPVTPNTLISFTDISTGGGSPSWDFGDLLSGINNSSTLTLPTHTYLKTGDFCITLISTNSNFCADTISKCIEVLGDPLIVIPNVFTPNGDGVNDVFFFYTEGVKELTCTIYDRWGLKMSEWNTVSGGWDGRSSSGNQAPDGVYFFVMTATPANETKEIIKQQGFVQLLIGNK